jgi:hypothetical protein
MYGSDLLDNELAAHVATTFAALVKQTPACTRHIGADRRGAQPRDVVAGDVRQAAELLETGLASLSRGTQTGGRNGLG